MCRSIKTLRQPYVDVVTHEDIDAAALQFVRKISGTRKPSKANQEAFDLAVRQIAVATHDLLSELTVAGEPVHLH